jgi:hypothetical protein
MENLKAAAAYDHKKQTPKSPDGLSLEPLTKYAKARDLVGADGDALAQLVQDRRNAIHAFRPSSLTDLVRTDLDPRRDHVAWPRGRSTLPGGFWRDTLGLRRARDRGDGNLRFAGNP